ncbi:hypothetical protein [Arthrobacter sp.]|uniref:hypothetical protein n=1 Tax=Arthrobacter sp. TaxID=1667 RepID=UPI0028128654|nr:hypothetical protein [Arthrobacter sp.]
MDNSLVMAFTVINSMKHDNGGVSRDTPFAGARRTLPVPRRRDRLRGWLASVLHRAAWAIEPAPPVEAEARP